MLTEDTMQPPGELEAPQQRAPAQQAHTALQKPPLQGAWK